MIKVKESKGKNYKFPLLIALFCLVKGKVFSFFLLFFSLPLSKFCCRWRPERKRKSWEKQQRNICSLVGFRGTKTNGKIEKSRKNNCVEARLHGLDYLRVNRRRIVIIIIIIIISTVNRERHAARNKILGIL